MFAIMDNVKTVLLIHGFATGPEVWEDQIRRLSDNFHVITDPGQLSRSESFFVVGWSMGGWKALELWQNFPQRVEGMVLVSAFAKYTRSPDYPCGTPLAILQRLEKKFLTDYKAGMAYFYNLIFKDKKMPSLIGRLPVPERKDLINWFDRLKNEDKRNLLSKIDIPVLIIHGAQDPVVSSAGAEYLNSKIKNSQLNIFSGAGHAPFLEEAEKFSLILKDFFNSYGN